MNLLASKVKRRQAAAVGKDGTLLLIERAKKVQVVRVQVLHQQWTAMIELSGRLAEPFEG